MKDEIVENVANAIFEEIKIKNIKTVADVSALIRKYSMSEKAKAKLALAIEKQEKKLEAMKKAVE